MWAKTEIEESAVQRTQPTLIPKAVDVEVNKQIFIDKADDMKIKMDEEKTGKVITQKNKLRNLIK